jgi:hypothetical protein
VQAEGQNYLIPVDMPLPQAADMLQEGAIPLHTVLRSLDGARIRVVFLDACRDNPLVSATRSLGGARGGLAALPGPAVTATSSHLVAFATAPGDVAQDGVGQHSPFTQALLRHLGTPGLELLQAMTRVTQDVQRATSGRQRPFLDSSMLTEVVLRPLPPVAADAAVAPGAQQPPRLPEQRLPEPRSPAPSALAGARAWAQQRGFTVPLLAMRGVGPSSHMVGAWAAAGQEDVLVIIADVSGERATVLELRGDARSGGRSERFSVRIEGDGFEIERDNGDSVSYEFRRGRAARMLVTRGAATRSPTRLSVQRAIAAELTRVE